MKNIIGKEVKFVTVNKILFNVRSVNLIMKKELFERVIVPKRMYGAKRHRFEVNK